MDKIGTSKQSRTGTLGRSISLMTNPVKRHPLLNELLFKATLYLKSNGLLQFLLKWAYRLIFELKSLTIDRNHRILLTESQSEVILSNTWPFKKVVEENQERQFDEQLHLSIIIPAYNVEAYIESCINSILGQATRFRYEIIVVNDGSTDGTLSRLGLFEPHENVRIFTQPNNGAARSRNLGLRLARGKYFMFVDADDELAPGAIETLLSEGTGSNADIVEGNFVFIKHGYQQLVKPTVNFRKAVNLNQEPDFILRIHGYPWGKIYARHLWDDLQFPSGLVHDDTIIVLLICRRAQHYIYVPNVVYLYRIHGSSITTTTNCTPKGGLDSFYVTLLLIEESKRLSIAFDPTFYVLILRQLGVFLYPRTKNLSSHVIEATIVLSRKLLLDLEQYKPKHMTYIDKCFMNSILTLNKEMWELSGKYLR